jgi:DNA phosphorothioation-associated putative methyltransferase
MLMTLGPTELIEERCRQSAIGQQRPNSLWVHVSALDQLDPLLRLYEGCASRTIGRPEEATAVKFHVQKPQITYLFYPALTRNPTRLCTPAWRSACRICTSAIATTTRQPAPAPPKRPDGAPDYPGYAKFAKLSQQERKWGLLDDVKAIFQPSRLGTASR